MPDMITDDDVRRNVADNVNRLLLKEGWSQSELARRTGDTQATISLICRGRHVCGAGILARIAEAFDVATDRLIGPPPQPAKKTLARAS